MNVSATEATVDRHYGGADICDRITAALASAGKDLAALRREDCTPFDEFHGGGITSTRDLALFAGVRAGHQVLDIGCGIGGPARTLAAEFGCDVTGVDLTTAFIDAAEMLTDKLNMADSCRFKCGSATAMPLPDGAFDVVWSQNMMMNIQDKATFFGEVHRVLRPGGTFAFEAVLAGSGEPVYLPTFWAADPAINFLVTRAVLENLLGAAGLESVSVVDTTQQVIENSRKRQQAFAAEDPTQLTISVIVPDDATIKMGNALRNTEEGRTTTIKATFSKPGT